MRWNSVRRTLEAYASPYTGEPYATPLDDCHAGEGPRGSYISGVEKCIKKRLKIGTYAVSLKKLTKLHDKLLYFSEVSVIMVGRILSSLSRE